MDWLLLNSDRTPEYTDVTEDAINVNGLDTLPIFAPVSMVLLTNILELIIY